MIKALFFDLDGTLLNSDRKISSTTRAILERCRRNGIKLYISTARPPLLGKMLSWDDDILSLFDGGAYYNGGCIIVGGHKTYTPISDNLVQEVIRHTCKYDKLNIALQLENEGHAFRFPLKPESYQRWGMSEDKILTLSQAKDLNIVKIVVHYSDLIDSTEMLDKSLIDILWKNYASAQRSFI